MGNKTTSEKLSFGISGDNTNTESSIFRTFQRSAYANNVDKHKMKFSSIQDDEGEYLDFGGRMGYRVRKVNVKDMKLRGLVHCVDCGKGDFEADKLNIQRTLAGAKDRNIPLLIFALNHNQPGAAALKNIEMQLGLRELRRPYYIQKLNQMVDETGKPKVDEFDYDYYDYDLDGFVVSAPAATATAAPLQTNTPVAPLVENAAANAPVENAVAAPVENAAAAPVENVAANAPVENAVAVPAVPAEGAQSKRAVPKKRREVWNPQQITTGLKWLQYAALLNINPKAYKKYQTEIDNIGNVDTQEGLMTVDNNNSKVVESVNHNVQLTLKASAA